MANQAFQESLFVIHGSLPTVETGWNKGWCRRALVMGKMLAPRPVKLRDKDRGTLGVNVNLLTDRLSICLRRETERVASWREHRALSAWTASGFTTQERRQLFSGPKVTEPSTTTVPAFFPAPLATNGKVSSQDLPESGGLVTDTLCFQYPA